ncbi:RICIN domain-containing protein [Pedobacter frigoris]|uniref:Ricin B lectin domain-containing protein n=1 Tax=Pedobacter frigoris TaxID=2571272 RepID=A0A4U1CPA7_9SPHI|nr:RICIN domain-containing protein [Pedobacter frigoris]TKC08585.1 hypothetical protein FA047_00335 [Pedobacter frigoris]
MKNVVSIQQKPVILQMLMLLAMALFSCSKATPFNQEGNSKRHPSELSTVQNLNLGAGQIVAAHRANELLKVDEIINAGIKSLEVDIFVGLKNGQPTLLVGHEAATATGQTLAQYFQNLNQKMPNFEHLWLDCKDLNGSANEQLFLTTLNSMDALYGIKNRVLVESKYIPYLVSFKQQGWTVSYYSNWEDVYGKTEAQQQTAMTEMFNKLTTYGIDGISYDASVNTPMKNFFATKTVGGNSVQMYAWALSRYYLEADLATKLAQYSNLSVLLITFKFNYPATLINGAKYKIVAAVNLNSVVDVNSSSPVNGTAVTLWSNNYPTSNNQVWLLRSLGNGDYAFKSVADTTKALSVTGGSSSNSTPIEVYNFSNSTAQKWKINHLGEGYYNMTPACAPGKNLDVNGGSTTNGTMIDIYTAHQYNAQKFRLVKQ